MDQYRIRIDREECIGDRACCEEAPDTFYLDEDGKVCVADSPGDPPESIMRAARACPLDAITLLDARTGAQVWPKLPISAPISGA